MNIRATTTKTHEWNFLTAVIVVVVSVDAESVFLAMLVITV